MKKKKKMIMIGIVAFVIIVFAAYTAWENSNIQLNQIRVEKENLPEGFEGFRIAQVSDLHNDSFGENNEKLIAVLKEAKPDIIAITGDLIDSRRTNPDVSLAFVKEAVKIAPCYYVTGNHESRLNVTYPLFEKALEASGVTVLRDESVIYEWNGSEIIIAGMEDPAFVVKGDKNPKLPGVISEKLETIRGEQEGFFLLLSHRPDYIEYYKEAKMDVVLSGHAHGGQFRLPFIGGLVVPNQGLFANYDAGLFEEDATSMVVSRGIGNSAFPFRLNNPPEVVLIELVSKEER